jgi:hypothetical protein
MWPVVGRASTPRIASTFFDPSNGTRWTRMIDPFETIPLGFSRFAIT